MLPDRFPQCLRDRSLLLNCLIRYAACCVQHPRCDECVRRARIEAPRAASAVIRVERAIRPQLQIEQQLTQKEKRPERRVDEIGALSDPAEPGALREIALEYRAGIDVGLPAHRTTDARLYPAMQLVQPIHHHIVIVVAPRIACDRTGWLGAAVVHRDYHGAPRPLVRQPGIPPLLCAAFQVVHLACVARAQPFVEAGCRVRRAECRDSHQIETDLARARLDPSFECA